MTRISPAELDARQRVRAAILPRGRRGYAVPRVARVSPGCRARQRVWPRTLAKIRAHGRGWVKTGHFAGFAHHDDELVCGWLRSLIYDETHIPRVIHTGSTSTFATTRAFIDTAEFDRLSVKFD